MTRKNTLSGNVLIVDCERWTLYPLPFGKLFPAIKKWTNKEMEKKSVLYQCVSYPFSLSDQKWRNTILMSPNRSSAPLWGKVSLNFLISICEHFRQILDLPSYRSFTEQNRLVYPIHNKLSQVINC